MRKIAILVLDTPIPGLKEKYGDFGDQGIAMLRQSKIAEKYDFVKFTTVGEFEHPSLQELKDGVYDAVYLSGSRSDSFDDSKPWIRELVAYLREIIQLQACDKSFKVKLIGVCFGHQVIGRALGLPVGRNSLGWEIGINKVVASGSFKETFDTTDFYIVEMHRDIVKSGDLPQGWNLIGSTDKCSSQGFYWANHVLSFQGHPEFSTQFTNDLVEKRYEDGGFSKEIYEDVIERGKQFRNDGANLSDVIMRFTEEEGK
ncbi:DEKNAAC100725 [Brettanomyces naardenensis]|uniref:DEKNAAC100725 n=1 Tax=Brettanomyces naardenensis TaxID=13370 RepID=A0A448YEH0_BRENA|nr:DEKNAAC100725 [Brettanomyces naardenensis]